MEMLSAVTSLQCGPLPCRQGYVEQDNAPSLPLVYSLLLPQAPQSGLTSLDLWSPFPRGSDLQRTPSPQGRVQAMWVASGDNSYETPYASSACASPRPGLVGSSQPWHGEQFPSHFLY